jgi:hypothetical protein
VERSFFLRSIVSEKGGNNDDTQHQEQQNGKNRGSHKLCDGIEAVLKMAWACGEGKDRVVSEREDRTKQKS